MKGRFFLDTNVLVYSFDPGHTAKRKRAQSLIEDALSTREGFISYQVIQEFLNVALRKFAAPMSVPEAKSYLTRVLDPLCDVFPSVALYHKVLDVRESTGWGLYDAVIVASALQGGAKVLYTEDLQSSRRVEGLFIQNPF
jgi:predicted nucleic acid-binding protein